MFRSYIVVAVRSLVRDRGFSTLNVLGLAVGMACCLLVAGFVQFETSYDRQHTQADRIYRVLRETRNADGESRFSSGTSGPLAAVMRAEIPEVERAARMWHHWISVQSETQHLYRTVAVVDPAFFDIFDYTMLSGSLDALESPGTVYLTEQNATALFGTEDPIGKPLRIQGDQGAGDYTVAGVFEEPAHSTTLWFDVVTAHHPPGFHRPLWEDWLTGTWRMTRNYILLRDGADPDRAEALLQPMLSRFLGPETGKTDTYHLQSLPRTHLYEEVDFGKRTDRSIDQVYTYALSAGLVLLIAGINFVNLSTARSSRRAREVGVRKASGARRVQLIGQFLGESVLLSLLSLAGAVVLMLLAQDTFNQLVGISLEPAWDIVPAAIPFAVVAGLLAGAYPAIVLSGSQPVGVLKTHHGRTRGAGVRKGLVVFQFASSILFVILSLTVRGQLTYIENRPLGYDEEYIAALWMTNRKPELYGQIENIKHMLLEHPNVISVAALHGWGIMRPAVVTARESGKVGDHAFHGIGTDPDFLSTFGMRLLKGRNLEPETPEILVNEAAVKAMGWDDPIGRQLKWSEERDYATVVGVIGDFHFQSLRSPVGPLIVYNAWFASQVNVRIRSTDVSATIDHFQDVWAKTAPEYPFDVGFIDEAIDRSYHADRQAARLSSASAAMAGLVASLGLLGLVAFATERRRKEISIRKVLGASAARVVGLLSREFLLLVAAANLISWPVAYIVSRQWLDSFVYRTDVGIEVFVLTALMAFSLAMATVATHTLKAVWADPVDALRDS
ncbi:MAG TPA: ABC transporter permease [Candidatus Latescibacteria bacterium]|jgi:putative ABC transport system permease protein|nr:hypothetical protein [Gemmatimonadaceae bacterium]MDP6016084.1 ABC transporter permease [Candidatus Latescibacterota bacterium]HJP31017.1 ABC transporter permease [Candidatus Latescibacterota bacterium]